MAQRIHVTLEDDLDGSAADETVHFGLDGRDYKIDLNKKNAKALRDALAPYVGVAERASSARGSRRSSSGGRGRSRSDASAVREWARSHGMEVSERGRISQEVQQAYDAAN